MLSVTISRDEFLDDRQGRTFVDVVNDPAVPFDEIIDFFNDENRQRRMEEAELHHDRAPLAGVVRELESQPAIDQFFATVPARRNTRVRQAIGVLVRIVMERRGWQKTGRKGSLGVRATVAPGAAAHNAGGLAFWFIRAERYEAKKGMPYRSVRDRCKELDTAVSNEPNALAVAVPSASSKDRRRSSRLAISNQSGEKQ